MGSIDAQNANEVQVVKKLSYDESKEQKKAGKVSDKTGELCKNIDQLISENEKYFSAPNNAHVNQPASTGDIAGQYQTAGNDQGLKKLLQEVDSLIDQASSKQPVTAQSTAMQSQHRNAPYMNEHGSAGSGQAHNNNQINQLVESIISSKSIDALIQSKLQQIKKVQQIKKKRKHKHKKGRADA